MSKWDAKGEDLVFVGYSMESKAYRLWRRSTTTVIKSHDVRFIEDPRFVTQKSQESVELPLQSENMRVEQVTDNDDDEATVEDQLHEDGTEESTQDEGIVQPSLKDPRRGPGRPKIVRTGQPGRPRKEYQTANIAEVENDPITVEEAMSSAHKDEWMEAM